MEEIAEDIYVIISKDTKKHIILDLTTPFVLNSSATIINVPYEDIIIKNSIGDVIAELKKETHLTIKEKNTINEDITYYFINLVDILFDPIEVEGYTYSKLYPIKQLEENEYGLMNGKIVTGKDIIINVRCKELIKEEVDVVKVVNKVNGNYFKRVTDNFTYYGEQVLNDEDLKTIVKLNSASIEKGSVSIELYYERTENYTSVETVNKRFININTKETPRYIETDQDQYLQD